MSSKTINDFYEQAFKEASQETFNKEEVFYMLQKSLESGDPRAAYALGTWYLHGEHVEKDLSKAMVLLEQAANKNISDACYDLAVCYEASTGVEQDLNKAFELYMRAALHGDSQSFYEVSRCYYYGIGVRENKSLADIWQEKAEELGVEG